MSTETGDHTTPQPTDDWVPFIEENRERIERIANSDAKDAWVFQRLLNYAEERGQS